MENQIESNKLIMNFMGIKPTLNSFNNKYSWSDGVFFSCAHDTEEQALQSIALYVKYSSSWDWLMKVVGKIVSELEFELPENEFRESIMDVVPFANIDDTYTAVVEFIKWYNQNKPSK